MLDWKTGWSVSSPVKLKSVLKTAFLILSLDAAEAALLTRRCPVFSEANSQSKVVCKRDAGTEAIVVEPMDRFTRVQIDQCEGYVFSICFKNDVSREPAAARRMRFGIGGNLAGLWSQVPGSTTLSKGIDWGIALSAGVPVYAATFRLKISYQTLALTRTVDGGGALDDPGIEALHRGKYAGLEFVTQWPMFSINNWVLDFGTQLLYPLSVIQQLAGTETTVNGSGNLLFAFLGSSLGLIQSNTELGLHFMYNLASDGRHHLIAVRFGATYIF